MRSTIRRIAPIAAVAMTVAFLACEESPTSIDSVADVQTAPQLSADAGNPVVLSVRGSGHVVGPKGSLTEPGKRTFSFTAKRRADGTTTGHTQLKTPLGQRQNGRVYCMADLGGGNIAIIAEGLQRVPENQPPNSLGAYGVPDAERPGNHALFFTVRDNGEGSNAPADQITGATNTTLGFANGLCAAGASHPLAGLAPAFLVDIDAGNIQVSQ